MATDNLEGEARLAVEGKQEPVQVEGKVVRHKNRKKHGLPSFSIRSLRQRCDRLEVEPRSGESQAQSVKTRQNLLDVGPFIERVGGVSPAIAAQ